MYFPTNRDLARYLVENLIEDPYAPIENKVMNLASVMEFLGIDRKIYITKDNFQSAYWDTVLYLENLNTLRGFSVICNIEKGNSNYNPERKRISTDWEVIDG